MRTSWRVAAVVAGLVDASAEASHAYKPCNASARYDGCECRGYRRGQDQVVSPSTHPTKAELCNLINLQTAFEYAVGAEGQGLTVILLRGDRYPLSGPGSGPYPRISLPPFRGYDEYPPTGCVEVPDDDQDSGRRPRSPRPRVVPPCPRYPKHQIQIFDAGGYRVTIDHLELDGGLDPSCAPRMPSFGGWRRRFARPALVELGWSAAASGTVFHDNVVVNAEGWTALHLGEGPLDEHGAPACRGVEVYGNTIADLGYNLCDLAAGRGGTSPQCYWTDGISMACAGSVRLNTIQNPTDVGIVAFVGGVSIEDNVIFSNRSKAFGGIVAVDEFARSDGTWVANHDDTVIARNTVRADPGGAFDIGIALGLWAGTASPGPGRRSPTRS